MLNLLTIDDEYTHQVTCYQLAQFVLKIGVVLAKKVGLGKVVTGKRWSAVHVRVVHNLNPLLPSSPHSFICSSFSSSSSYLIFPLSFLPLPSPFFTAPPFPPPRSHPIAPPGHSQSSTAELQLVSLVPFFVCEQPFDG